MENFSSRKQGIFYSKNFKQFFKPAIAKADAPHAFRIDWGGHDPATPIAEMQYNYFWTVWPVVMFVAVQAVFLAIK